MPTPTTTNPPTLILTCNETVPDPHGRLDDMGKPGRILCGQPDAALAEELAAVADSLDGGP